MPKNRKYKTGGQPHSFQHTPQVNKPRSSFDLSHGFRTTFDADLVIPIGVWDIMPGDSWNVNTTVVARLATPLHPIMDSIEVTVFYFFVPYRILWDSATGSWQRFMGEQDNPTDSIDYTIPVVTGSNARTGEFTLWDYFGLPLIDNASGNHVDPDDLPTSALPFRANTKIRNDWFRDENQQESWNLNLGNGPDNLESIAGSTPSGGASGTDICAFPFTRAKKHDYFTSALPWPQKGDSVDLPLGTVAPVLGIGILDGAGAPNASSVSVRETGASTPTTYTNAWNTAATTTFNIEEDTTPGATNDYPGVYADLTNASSATINELRQAFQIQALLEIDARSGTRYVETLKAHWGVTFPDYTAQRAVLLGVSKQPLGITPVPQTTYEGTPTADNTKGALAGYGYSDGQHGFTKSFVEHGVVMAYINAVGTITYSQGQDKYWAKSTRYDFPYPILSGLGEQAILNKEIYVDTGDGLDDAAWGYTGRYNEMRFLTSKNTGLMRPDAAGTLASWHLQENFVSRPALGETFILSNTADPLDRAIAVTTEPHFIADIWHDIKAARPLPLYGTPLQLDRF